MKKLTIRLSDELHDRLVALALADHRSINKQVTVLIDHAVSGDKSQDTSQTAEDKEKGEPVEGSPKQCQGPGTIR